MSLLAPRRRAVGALALLLVVWPQLGCPPRGAPLPEAETLTPEAARLRLEREGMERQRLSAVLRARMAGLEGLLASADIDVAIETPAKVFLAVRSFFEQPLYVLATDGVSATVLDATRPEGPAFFAGPVNGAVLEGLLGVELWPHEVVALLLGIAPAPGAEPIKLEIDARDGTYTLTLAEPRGRLSVVTARREDDALLAWRAFSEAGEPLFTARYQNLSAAGGHGFPRRWELTFQTPEGPRSVVFEARELEVDGAAFDPRLFRLEPPPGLPVRPLSRRSERRGDRLFRFRRRRRRMWR